MKQTSNSFPYENEITTYKKISHWHLPDNYTQCTKWGYQNCWSIDISHKVCNLSNDHCIVQKYQSIRSKLLYNSAYHFKEGRERERESKITIAKLTCHHACPPKWLQQISITSYSCISKETKDSYRKHKAYITSINSRIDST